MTHEKFISLLESIGMDVNDIYIEKLDEHRYIYGRFRSTSPYFDEMNSETLAFYNNEEFAIFISRKLRYRIIKNKFRYMAEPSPYNNMTKDFQRYEMTDDEGIINAINYLSKEYKRINNVIELKLLKKDFA